MLKFLLKVISLSFLNFLSKNLANRIFYLIKYFQKQYHNQAKNPQIQYFKLNIILKEKLAKIMFINFFQLNF